MGDGYGVAWRRFRPAHVTRSCSQALLAMHPPCTMHCGRPPRDETGWRERERERDARTAQGIDVPSCARNYGLACSRDAVVLNWLTATKFDGGVCFSSFILILRESTPPPPLSPAIRMHSSLASRHSRGAPPREKLPFLSPVCARE